MARVVYLALVMVVMIGVSGVPALAAFGGGECGDDCKGEVESSATDSHADGNDETVSADEGPCEDSSCCPDGEPPCPRSCNSCGCSCCVALTVKLAERGTVATLRSSTRLELARAPTQRIGFGTSVRVFRPPRLAA